MNPTALLNRPISSVELESDSTAVGLTGIIPVEFIQPDSRAARLWCFVRSLDHPSNGGTGSGMVTFNLCDLIVGLNRSGRSCYRYLKAAKQKGYIYWYQCTNEVITLKYRSLEKIARLLQLKTIGAVVAFPLDQLEHARAIAAEGQAEALQAQSFHLRSQEWGRFAKGQPKAEDLLTASESAKVAGLVVARGHRLLYLAPNWRPFGGSQSTIAKRLGVSVRTIANRLSHSWREARGMRPLIKAQTAKQVFEDYDLGLVKALYKMTADAAQKWVRVGRRMFERGCNLYKTQCQLRSQKCRKALFRDAAASPIDNLSLSPEIEPRRSPCWDLRVLNLSVVENPET